MPTKLAALIPKKARPLGEDELVSELALEKWGLPEPPPQTAYYALDFHLCRLRRIGGFLPPGVSPFDADSIDEDDVAYRDIDTWNCVSVVLSTNHITRLRGLHELGSTLLHCDLSVNHLESLGNGSEFASLHKLRVLNLSANALQSLEGLGKLGDLRELDASCNRIVHFRGLEGAPRLEVLRLKSNRLEVVEGLHTLKLLKDFDCSNNELVDVVHLSFLPSLTKLDLGHNRLEDLDEMRDVLLCLSRLTELNLHGNPVEHERGYRLRVLENPAIKWLDDSEIKPFLRDHLKDMKKKEDLDEMVELTTNEYMQMIQAEHTRKQGTITGYKKREKELDGVFSRFKSHLEIELEDCVQYIQDLANDPEAMNASFLATEEGLLEWKRLIQESEMQRRFEAQQEDEERATAARLHAAKRSDALSYTQKLHDLSLKRPDLWRKMKRRELGQREKEEARSLSEASRVCALTALPCTQRRNGTVLPTRARTKWRPALTARYNQPPGCGILRGAR